MPREKGNQPPPRPGNHEQEPLLPYLQFRRYTTEESSAISYFGVQETLRAAPVATDLSVYRVRVAPTLDFHVAVLGEIAPPDVLQAKIAEALADGQPAEMPPDLLQLLLQRRAEGKRRGGWSEKHYRPGQGQYYPRRDR